MTLASDALATKISELIDAEVMERWQDFCHVHEDDTDVDIDGEQLVAEFIETVKDDLVSDLLAHKAIINALIMARITVREISKDARLHDENPLAYYGMKQSDFV